MTDNSHPLLAMLQYVRPHLLMLGASTLLRSLNLLLGMLMTGLSAYLISVFILSSAWPETYYWWSLVGLGVVKAICRYLEQISGHVAAFRILDTLRGQLYDGFAQRMQASHSLDRSGDLVSRAMADVELVEVYFAHTLAPLISAVLYIAGLFVVLHVWLSFTSALLICSLLITGGLLTPLLFQRFSAQFGMQIRMAAGDLSASLSENLAGIQDLISNAALEREIKRVEQQGKAFTGLSSRLTLNNGVKSALVDLFLVAALLMTVSIGFTANSQTPELIWSLVAAMAGGFGALLSISRAVDDLPKSSAAASRIFEIINNIECDKNSITQNKTSLKVTETPALSVKNLSYRYSNHPGIQNISFTAKPGEHIFITGPSGSGKSTLVSQLLRLQSSQSGQIRLNNHSITDISSENFRQLVSGAIQDAPVVQGSVHDNLVIGLAEGETDIPDAALTIPMIPSLYQHLPNGKDTLVSGTDEQISGGQKKRIALARLLARQPRILILDEAFSGLDADLRQKIRSSLLAWAKQNQRTIIEVSHEISEAKDADQRLVLNDGKLVE